jgi:hypothetical protein
MSPGTTSREIRSRVTLDEINGLLITIPSERSGIRIVYFSVLLLTSVVVVTVILTMIHAPSSALPILGIWLIGWTVAGALMMDALVWQVCGREVIGIDANGENLMVLRLGTLLPRRTRSFPLHEVRNLRFSPPTTGDYRGSQGSFRENLEARLSWLGTAGGNIAIDHDGKVERFGSDLPESESRRLIRTIKDHYKIRDDTEEPLPVERL